MDLALLAIREPEVFWLRHEKNTFLHSHKKFSFVDIWVGQEHPSFPEIRPEIIFPVLLITFINHQHTSVNFMVICFYPQLLRNDGSFSNKLCAHETSITVVRIILNTLLTEIDGSFSWEDDTILVGHGGTGLKDDVHCNGNEEIEC